MEHILEITGTVTGLLYLWLEYRASIYLWIAGIIMPAVYIFVYYDAGLYADFGINIYYLGAAIYGWMMWKYGAVLRRTILKRKDAPQRGENNRTEEQKQELSITYMPTRYLLPLTAVFTAAFLGIAWILINFTDSNVPWLDSFTTALSIVGMWMLARKYVEQWWAWIAVDAVTFRPIAGNRHLHRYYNFTDMKDELSTSNEQLSTIDAVVLANGEYPAGPLPLKILAEAPYVVCCDGGANEYIRRGHTPDVIIGDGDSLSDENRRKFGHILHRISDQETNDQTKAVNFLLAQGKRRIAIIGATGKREDHTLGNISLLIDYLRAGADVRTYTDYGIFIPCRSTRTFPSHPGQQVSIINFTAHGLHGKGLVYPLSDFTNWWQGTLNECTSTEFTIEAEGEYLVFVTTSSLPPLQQSTR